MPDQPNNPLQNKTLQHMVEFLVDTYGWEKLGQKIKIKCFTTDPTIKSSLVFLRRTPWARTKVEQLYVYAVRNAAKKSAK
jgi:uncharacterized protein (DUF2132 family)